ncbi:MAG: peptidylprolyl isomerase [Pseudoalteromonas sp.]|uniref:peptidylprolyl isomerase n=1 Tax=unclassified Pseudoalteromonas TaxID=194690 RepID=UPI000C068534|nr:MULTISPECIES: peptidylprolyl isomerase [unclassified Pseudoalteromonas]MDB2356154.1 peptidylprolyl isomerase [Pseudoalteromonas sp.]MDP2636041.1 peptidylprolyl isomerase [Pseudoalteromonas sp. 1_MG-2023]PHN90638.1 peptidylprolyl isomerase [Pseudoalteromonas sp. 3D05]TGE85434.1 peptidylprolyl isomerase [Pseudoalteromonas sp. KS88]
MKRIFLFFALLFISQNITAATEGRFVQKNNMFPRVEISTTMGKIIVEMDRSKAPITVNNFLTYVMDGSYNGTVFHRVERDIENERDFVIQGGGYDKEYDGVYEGDPIFNESGNGSKNDMYSIAMAYQDRQPHSGTRQFFFNMDDNDHLNPGREWGFAVFGMVMDGYETLDKIMQVETGFNEKIGYDFVPKTPVVILNMAVLEPTPL